MDMSNQSQLPDTVFRDYLIALYFGFRNDYLLRCIRRAYRDLSRTVHGIQNHKQRDDIIHQAEQLIVQEINELANQQETITSQREFDKWHQDFCDSLCTVFNTYGMSFYVGQAQKWINMTLKYIFTLLNVGIVDLPALQSFYNYAHAPVDSVIIGHLSKYGIMRPKSAWSKIKNYDIYIDYQNRIRQTFQTAPLDTEFLLWMGKAAPIKT